MTVEKKRFVDRERIEKLAKPKHTIAQVLGFSEVSNVRPGAPANQHILPSDHQQQHQQSSNEKQRSKSQPRNQPLVVEYSSYGRKANDMQGREGHPPPLPWTFGNAPKITRQHHESEVQESYASEPTSTIEREPRLKIHPKPITTPAMNTPNNSDMQFYWEQRSDAANKLYDDTEYATRFQINSKPFAQNRRLLPSTNGEDSIPVQPILERKKPAAEESLRKSEPDLPWEDTVPLAFGRMAANNQTPNDSSTSQKNSIVKPTGIAESQKQIPTVQTSKKNLAGDSKDISEVNKNRGRTTADASGEGMNEDEIIEDLTSVSGEIGLRNNGKVVPKSNQKGNTQGPLGKINEDGDISGYNVKEDAEVTEIQEEYNDNYITIFDDSEDEDDPDREPVVEGKPTSKPQATTITRKEYINPFKSAKPLAKNDSPAIQTNQGLLLPIDKKGNDEKNFHKALTPDFTNEKDTPVNNNRYENIHLSKAEDESFGHGNKENLKLNFQQSQASLRVLGKESNRYSTVEEPGEENSTKKLISGTQPRDEKEESQKELEFTLGNKNSENKKQNLTLVNNTLHNSQQSDPFESKPLILRSMEKKTPVKLVKEPQETSEKLPVLLLPFLPDVTKQGLDVNKFTNANENLRIGAKKSEDTKILDKEKSNEFEIEEIDLP